MNLSRWNPFKFRRPVAEMRPEVKETGKEQIAREVKSEPTSPYALMQQMLRDPFFVSPFRTMLSSDPWFGDFSEPIFRPKIDVTDATNALMVTAELPGMNKGDFEVHVQQGNLILEGEKRHEASSEENGCYRTERSYGYFRRSIPIPSDVAVDGIEATYDKGVLNVRLPKKVVAEPVPTRVDVKG